MASTDEVLLDLQQRLMAVRDGVLCLASAIAEQPDIDATKLHADVWLAMDRLPHRRGKLASQEFLETLLQAIVAGSLQPNPPPAPDNPRPAS